MVRYLPYMPQSNSRSHYSALENYKKTAQAANRLNYAVRDYRDPHLHLTQQCFR